MIGQSLINVSSGARARLSGIVAVVMLLVFILFGAPLIERLPMAALTGLMDKADNLIEVNHFEDPTYKVLTDQT